MRSPRATLMRLFLAILLGTMPVPLVQAGSRALSFEDVMHFEAIYDPVISVDGHWLAFEARPDRGDGRAEIHSLETETVYRVERGSKPLLSRDSRWAAVRLEPPFEGEEKAGREKGERRKPGMVLINTQTGEKVPAEDVEEFRFSKDSRWLFYWKGKTEDAEKGKKEEDSDVGGAADEEPGRTLVIRWLEGGAELEIPHVNAFDVHPFSQGLVYCLATPGREANGVYWRTLTGEVGPAREIWKQADGRGSSVTWNEKGDWVAFLAGAAEPKQEPEVGPPSGEESAPDQEISLKDRQPVRSGSLHLWDRAETRTAELPADSAADWVIPLKNKLQWTRDGKRLFFGVKPVEEMAWVHPAEKSPDSNETPPSEELFDIERILENRELDLWHWNDSRIKTQEKKMWPEVRDSTYAAVYHVSSGQVVRLAHPELPRVDYSESMSAALGLSDVPYLKEITWGEDFYDIFHIDLETGTRNPVARRVPNRGAATLSPDGRYVAYYLEEHWHLFDAETGSSRNLTEGLETPFFNEDHDYPGSTPGYGSAGWTRDGSAVLIYDKYDTWEFFTDSRKPICLTGRLGRQEATQYRVIQTDPKKLYFEPRETLLLSGYRDRSKNFGFFSVVEGQESLLLLLEEPKRFQFIAKAEESGTFLYTRESYDEFPDLWVSDSRFGRNRRVTHLNSQMDEFDWGSAELVEWNSLDGKPLQGVLVKPGGYTPGKRYPVIVYFYRFFSQRLHEFNQPVVNHRPCFPLYSSNGYALFLPDIRFEVGRPGLAAVKSLVPGVEKLVEMGIADPKAIGLHGHSWSGYQTAYIITQTDRFAAAVAGAPVSNMTSAYGGIRLGSGRARQFQYEQAQSRIGGSLWEYPERYIENSPLFFADRIQTPLLIQFGDEDDAVPWQQGVELYLAMRRLGKDCIFLQYRGEPHHLKKYPNKLDYAIKMKEYFDHHLKGMPAPEWVVKGQPYRGQ